MRPSYARPKCSSNKPFTPSAVLWQHFVVPLSSRRFFSSSQCYQQQPSPNGQLSETIPSEAESHPTIWPKDPRAPFRRHLIDPRLRWQSPPHEAEPHGLRAMKTALKALETSGDYDGVVIHPTAQLAGVDEGPPWYCRDWLKVDTQMRKLDKEMDLFCLGMRPLPHLFAARQVIATRMRAAIRARYPLLELEVIGSQRTGLALNLSDIDLRIFSGRDADGQSLTKRGPRSIGYLLPRIASALSRITTKRGPVEMPAYEDIEMFHSRVPLVQLYDALSGLKIQIVASKDSSYSRLKVASYVEEYPYLPKLYTVVKTMFDTRGLSDVFMGGFGSYPILMMIVASLKHHPPKTPHAAPALINFLEYWSFFDTSKGVSIDPPVYFDKAATSSMSNPAVERINVGNRKPQPEWMLYLRDPADLQNNLGRKGASIKHVQATCIHLMNIAHDTLKEAVDTKSSLLQHIVGPAYSTPKRPLAYDPRLQQLHSFAVTRFQKLERLKRLPPQHAPFAYSTYIPLGKNDIPHE